MSVSRSFHDPNDVDFERLSNSLLALGITDVDARYNRVAAFGELMTAQPNPRAAWAFDYGLNTDIVSSATLNTGSVTASNSKATLSTGTHAAGSATMRTINTMRYYPGLGGLVRFTAVFTQGVANSHQVIGMGDANDGFFFGFNGTSFGVLRRRAGVDTWIPQAEWNGESVSFDPTKGNVYQIRYQWLGFGYIRFYVLNPQNPAYGFTQVHVIQYPNTSTDVSILNPSLPLWAEAVNTGNTSNVVVSTPSGGLFSEGGLPEQSHPMDVFRAYDAAASFSSTDNNHLMTLRNKTTFNGIVNRVAARLKALGFAAIPQGSASVTFRVYLNATFANTLTYADVADGNSPMEVSTTTTTITSGSLIGAFTLATDSLYITLPNEAHIHPGSTITLSSTSSTAATANVNGMINWIDEL